ncbi:MAG: outer membrane lipid asymmetry maintenance protein MlaD [Alphaproteobacteria bacterium]|nr:outer membrane lipid asymmetry maintenance protein MlaD [Alphaproteobacteria bacterium]
MKHNVVEAVIGAVVLAVAAAFVVFAYTAGEVRPSKGYELVARFSRIDGINVGSDVRVSGIKVGSVTRMGLDPKTYLAEVRFALDPSIRMPVDTVAAVSSTGLLGDKFLDLVPGGDEKELRPGEAIRHTQASVSIENLIGQYMFSQGGDKKGEPAAGGKKE